MYVRTSANTCSVRFRIDSTSRCFGTAARCRSPPPRSRAKGQTLIDSRELYDSYVYNLIPDGLEFGSNKEYARIHHFGGDAGRGHSVHIEARPVLGVNDRDADLIGQMLLNAVRMM